MSYALTPQQVLPAAVLPQDSATLNLDEIQGDVLVGMQKRYERFVFFAIADVAGFKAAVRDLVLPEITTTRTVVEREHELASRKAAGKTDVLPLVGTNVGFTQTGINKLLGAATPMGDSSFQAGAAARAASKTNVNPPDGSPPTKPINDPVDASGKLTTWLPPFLGDVDGVFLITGGTASAVDHQFAYLRTSLGATWTVAFTEVGNVRPGAEAGHEHFGWQDGISQPAVRHLSTPFPGQVVVEPGRFVFGYPQTPGGPVPPLAQPWMANGSFMAFRRLQQLVPEFTAFIQNKSAAVGWDPVIIGARLVGRWKSGAPVTLTPAQDDLAMAASADQNNNFDFADDTQERRCPFSAHIRKANPRADLAAFPGAVDSRRMIRQGIPYGPEVSDAEAAAQKTQSDRGLLFVSYQASILSQFEFVQGSWINDPTFVSPGAVNMPPGTNPGVTVGVDPIMGQPANGTARTPQGVLTGYPAVPLAPSAAGNELPMTDLFIKPTGGGYFFMPSISALRDTLS
jgi:Dyp-type peroxidase family